MKTEYAGVERTLIASWTINKIARGSEEGTAGSVDGTVNLAIECCRLNMKVQRRWVAGVEKQQPMDEYESEYEMRKEKEIVTIVKHVASRCVGWRRVRCELCVVASSCREHGAHELCAWNNHMLKLWPTPPMVIALTCTRLIILKRNF